LADFEGKLYLFGGWDGQAALDVVYVYDPVEDAWREGTRMETARRDAGAVALADKIVVLGGRNEGGALTEAAGYFPSRDAGGEDPWNGFVALPEARYGFGAANVSDTLYIIGGELEGDVIDAPLGLIFSESAWNALEVEMNQDFQSPRLIPVGSLLYAINTSNDRSMAEVWSYTAFYYEIFLPIIQ
jgi:hypothetical protein